MYEIRMTKRQALKVGKYQWLGHISSVSARRVDILYICISAIRQRKVTVVAIVERNKMVMVANWGIVNRCGGVYTTEAILTKNTPFRGIKQVWRQKSSHDAHSHVCWGYTVYNRKSDTTLLPLFFIEF